MAEGRTRDAWRRCSSVLAAIFEVHRDRKKRSRPFRPEEFDPFVARNRKCKMTIAELKPMLAGLMGIEPPAPTT